MEKGNSGELLVGMQTGAATLENSMEFPQKVKNRITYVPIITLPGIYPKNTKTLIQWDKSIPMFIEALFMIAKIWKQAKCPSINEWIKMKGCVCACVCVCVCVCVMEYYSAIKRMKSCHLQ